MMTHDEIKQFQRTHADWEGKPLVVDGDPGPKTEWALAISKLDVRRQLIVARATSKVGLHELDSNRGPEIDEWLERCKVARGSSWCAAFASWCLSVSGMPDVRQAGAQALGKKFPVTYAPLPGDVSWFPTGKWEGHIGIFIGGDVVQAAVIEGNSANMVRPVRRLRRDVSFGSVLDSEAGAAPVPPGLVLVPVASVGTR